MSHKQLEYLLIATTWIALIAVAGLLPACSDHRNEPSFAGYVNAKEFFDTKDRQKY